MGQEDEAIRDFERLLKKNSESPKLLAYLGSAYFRKDSYVKAVEYLNRALTLLESKKKHDKKEMPDKNQRYQIYHYLAASHMKLNQSSQAVGHMKKACEMKPSLKCREDLGNLYYQLGYWEPCIQELAYVIQRRKDDKDLYAKLGVAFSKKGDNVNAVSMFREGLRYITNKAEQATIHKNIGFSLIQLQQWDMAMQDFQYAISNNYNDAESHMGLGIVKIKKSNLMGAVESFEMALKINPNLEQAKNLMETVKATMKQMSNDGTSTARFVSR